jgi:hypothetical protein
VSNPVLDQERVEFLRARSVERVALLPAWPRQQKELPLKEIEVDWVRFSTLNHRTKAEQLRAIHVAKRADLFTADPLGMEAQQAQYNILRAQESFEDLKKDLRERNQLEPAVISAEGVLINGNRRSAALRSLYHDDHVLGARYVRCLVLPDDATADELVNLETELQVARDFKEDYSWVNEAMLIEELYEREGRNFAHVARVMHRAESDVKSLYEKLQQLHQLVALSKGNRLHIDFSENESAFDELAKHIRTKPKSEQESVRSTYFLGTLAGVNYRTLRHLRRADAADLVYKELNANKALSPFLDVVSTEPADEGQLDDPLDDLLGDTGKPNDLMGILGYLATKNREDSVGLSGGGSVQVQHVLDTIRDAVVAAAADAEEEADNHSFVTTPITRLDEAIAKVQRASESLARARSLPDWKEADFQVKVVRLRNLLLTLDAPK